MSALEVFKGFPSTREEIEYWKQSVKRDIIEGLFDYEILAELPTVFKKVEALSELMKDKEVKEEIRIALDKFNQKNIRLNGCEIQLRKSPGTWDFSACLDPVYHQLVTKLELAKEKLKEREMFLKTITDDLNIVTDDGEVVTIKKAKFTSGEDSYSVKII
jgi:hypothetical protein